MAEFLFLPTVLSLSGLWSKIVARYRSSLLCELLTYLEDEVFTIRAGKYESFSMEASDARTLRNIILGVAIGILIASGASLLTKQKQGGFVRKLLREECFSPEQAKTLAELGYFSSLAVRKALTNGLLMQRLVKNADPEGTTDLDIARFYIPEEQKYLAKVRFEKEEHALPIFLLTAVVTVAVAVLLCRYLPSILSLLDLITNI